MTKSTITRERLEWLSQISCRDDIEDIGGDEIRELASIALAAMDSEPVAEVVSIYGDPEAFGEREIRPLVGIQQMPYGTKLYRHAQPAQVVPEEATPDSIEILASGRCRDHVVYQWDEDQRNAAADSWNACRAAMLEADPQLPGSDSAPVPGSWIPVSERLPDENAEQQVLACFKGGDISTLYYFEGRWDDAYGIVPIRQDVTHWMPLPAAPQEAINVLIPLVSRNEREVK
ncbi:TPA: DUF551 domain-containing protein [Klebsiella pneumoniae]|uniref:DUF551 domain-containing protein n=1 Tax=Klebsiella pneumoniae TaxID=573 RepID=UPI0039BB2FD9|nr:DUF551 domain-containing protein [Klebsiella pneumoniae]HDG8070779.1 DUF551 domain-containing protein [Klebsiella pneumoniae]HDG8083157.1 DUF551 domain-containing protein [Klebsiella pneumoniae]